MTATHISGPLLTGDKLAGETNGPNQGYAVLEQATSIAQNGETAVSSTLYIPAGSRIIDVVVDVMTAFDSVTSAVLTVGVSDADTTYAGAVNAKTAGRVRPTFTAAQLAAMAGVDVVGAAAATVAPVVITVTPTGATTAGYVQVAVIYAQQ